MASFDRSNWQRKALQFAHRHPSVGEPPILAAMRHRMGSRVVTRAKVRNFVHANVESDAGAVHVESLPYIVNIDSVNACNLACPFCVTGTRQLDRRKSLFDTEKARRLIDLVADHTLLARFHNWGEPFLNKDIFELINHAHKANIYTAVSSNLSIEVEGLGEKIVKSGLDNLHVSIDGLSQETLEVYRRNADFDLVIRNIREIVAAKRALGSKTPRMELAFLVFRHNEHEVSQIKAMRRELGVEAFFPSRAFIYHDSFVPENPAYSPYQHIWEDRCHYLYSELMVEADGKVSPCCTNSSERFDVGHVDELTDLKAFWNRPAYQAMRAKSSGKAWTDDQGKPMETLCDFCEYVGSSACSSVIGRSLSPLPPALIATGQDYNHQIDNLGRRVANS